MNCKSYLRSVLFASLLACAVFAFIGCGGYTSDHQRVQEGPADSGGNDNDSSGGGQNSSDVISPPVITVQPLSASYDKNAPAQELFVQASGGELSYEWYKSFQNSADVQIAVKVAATEKYAPQTHDIGTSYYFVVITNPKGSVTSATAKIDINEGSVSGGGAQAPTISAQPKSANYSLGGTPQSLSVKASVGDSGTLSYQWYSADNGGTPIADKITAYFMPSASVVGTFYYYVVVTNTKDAKTASVKSDIATIVITPPPPTITGVTITQGDVVIEKGANLGFNAVVTGEHNPSQVVGWSVTGGYSVATRFEDNVLYVASDENAAVLTVSATSIADTSKWAEVTVSVKEPDVCKDLSAPYFCVRFYDSDLNPIAKHAASGTITLAQLQAGTWYEAGGSSPTTSYYLSGDKNFYKSASVAEISDVANLKKLKSSGKYILTSDITLSAAWDPLDDFKGVLNGNGYKIKNLRIVGGSGVNDIGLFRELGGTVKNLGIFIDDSSGGVTGMQHRTGSIAGTLSGTIENSFVIGKVSGSNVVGGLVGNIEGGTIRNSFYKGYVYGHAWVGGIAGADYYSEGFEIIDSYSSGNVEGYSDSSSDDGGAAIGGIIGYAPSEGLIVNCYSDANITSKGTKVGGIAGEIGSGTVLKYNAAINPKITGKVPLYGGNPWISHIAGNYQGVNLPLGSVGNIALDSAVLTPATLVRDYTLKPKEAFSQKQTYTAMFWRFGDDADNPWYMPNGANPRLYISKEN